MDFQFTKQSILLSLLNAVVKPVFLLGAGASKQSGVMLASEMVEEIAKWGYCNSQGMKVTDPRLTISDWKKWVKNFPWFIEDYNELYPKIVDELLRPQIDRRDFFLRMINPDVKASKGYEVIAELMHNGLLDTVLTTNFDNCLSLASGQVRMPYHINLIKTPIDLERMLSYTPRQPQLVYLHGSVEHYTDQNLIEEVQHLNGDLINALKPILRDRPLVVIGYRGSEPSIMQDLLFNNLRSTNNFHNGIYWCVLQRRYDKDSDLGNNISPLVQKFAEKVGRNFQFVGIEGFDELMTETLSKLKAAEIDLKNVYGLTPLSDEPNVIQPADVTAENTVGLLEIAVIRERIKNYSERLRIKVYEEEEWLLGQMVRLRIASQTTSNHIELTSSGILLFSSKTQTFIPQAVTVLKFIGELNWLKNVTSYASENNVDNIDYSTGSIERIIRGNIWNQLNEITDSLSIVNKPFRLKGEVSENVYPYPTLALKEIIVNSLVHRNYRIEAPIIIEVTASCISFVSPGGLVEEVKIQLAKESFEDVIKNGKRGIKGYRNPVLADLFYGSGAMDKEGSGLSDVVKKVDENSCLVSFGQIDNEQNFRVIIYRRVEEVNDDTKTATPLKINETTKFACNLLEVLNLPDQIFHAETYIRVKKEVWSKLGNIWHPPYILNSGRMWSFFDLSDRKNPLSMFVDLGTVETISTNEFLMSDNGTNDFIRMLNDSVENHFSSVGLRVDRRKMRAYFTKTIDGNSKEIKYQGRIKKATRTVAKPRINPTSGRITYWEHKAIWFGFEKIGDTWYLILNPTYVFTTDGYKFLLKSKRASSLSTKRASRDYNMHVHNDLTFWSTYISNGNEGAFNLRFRKPQEEALTQLDIPSIIISSKLPVVSISDISITEDFIEPDFLEESEDIEKEIEFIAEQQKEEEMEKK
jgi:NAD-dependent SIR2 family protein deacetylase